MEEIVQALCLSKTIFACKYYSVKIIFQCNAQNFAIVNATVVIGCVLWYVIVKYANASLISRRVLQIHISYL